MTPRIANIEADLDTNRDKRKALDEERRRLEEELRNAKLDYGKANPHEWTGKKVKRNVQERGRGLRAGRRRGTVTIYDPALHRGVRNYTPGPGEAFVLTASKLTAYRLDTRPIGGSAWELDS